MSPSDPGYFRLCHRVSVDRTSSSDGEVLFVTYTCLAGIPELGIPSCEPLQIKQLVLNQGHGAVTLTSTYTDIKVYGPTEFRLDSVG
jgi:hypothetical protein